MLIRKSYLLFFFFNSIFLVGQQPVFKKFDTKQGLLSNTVYDIKQDKIGFIWFATDKGLARFDGKKFKNYTSKENKSKAVSNILVFDNGSVFVQNFNGQFFEVKNDKLVYRKEWSKHSNFNLGHDFDGSMMACLAGNGILMSNHKIPPQKKISLEPGYWISSVNSTASHFFLMNLVENKIVTLDKHGKINYFNQRIPFKNDFIHWVVDTENQYFVAKLKRELFVRNTNTYYDFSELYPNAFVQNASLISNKHVAILTTNGIILFDAKNYTFQRIFDGISCSKLIRDSNGNWWVSTIDNGVFFIKNPSSKLFFVDKNITCIDGNKNEIFLGTQTNEIFRLALNSKKTKLILEDSVNHSVKSIFYNERKRLLSFCSLTFKQFNGKHYNSQLPISVNHISQVDDDHYLLSESSNLSIFPIKNKADKWLSWLRDSSYLTNQRLSFFKENKRILKAIFQHNEIFALANDGLWSIRRNEMKRLNVGSNSGVIDIFGTANGILLATGDNRIYHYSKNKLVRLKVLDEILKNKVIRKVKWYANTYFLLTETGLFIVNNQGKLVQHELILDSQELIEVNDFVVIGKSIYVATSKGLQVIPLASVQRKNPEPKLILDEIFINGSRADFKEGMLLKNNQNSLVFNFSLLDFHTLGVNQLWYSINGKKWRILEDNSLTLNELATGVYRLRVRSISFDNRTNTTFLLSFTIIPPFYQRWWFYFLMIFLTFVIGVGLFRFRLRQIEMKNKILKENLDLEKKLHESSLAAIKSQMNPHFLFNALNTIQSFIYTNEKEAASSYLVDFSELTRKILEMSNKNHIPLAEEIEALRLYLKLEKMRFEEDFSFEIDTSKMPHLAFQIPSMLIQPYVENAIKHGLLHKKDSKFLKLQFELKGNVLMVTIIDNGIGRKASQKINTSKIKQHESFATVANQKRFSLLNQLSVEKIGVEFTDLENELGKSLGTKVVLSIPIADFI